MLLLLDLAAVCTGSCLCLLLKMFRSVKGVVHDPKSGELTTIELSKLVLWIRKVILKIMALLNTYKIKIYRINCFCRVFFL